MNVLLNADRFLYALTISVYLIQHLCTLIIGFELLRCLEI
jgi:hypothetical protein